MSFWRDTSVKKTYAYRGYLIPVDISFDNVYTIWEVFQHPRFTVEQKCDTIFEVIVEEDAWSSFDRELREDFVIRFMKDELGHDMKNTSEDDMGPPPYDYIEDAGRIHASFLFDYGMDLREQQGKLDWHTFQHLLFNLSGETQFMKAIHYRTSKPPKKTDYNAEEIQDFKDKQAHYALKDSPTAELNKRKKEQEILARMEAHKKKVKGG